MASEAFLSLWSPAKKLGILGVLEDLVGIAIGLIGLWRARASLAESSDDRMVLYCKIGYWNGFD